MITMTLILEFRKIVKHIHILSAIRLHHSAGKHDRPPYTPHTIYPLYYYTPFTVFQVLRLAKSSSAVIF